MKKVKMNAIANAVSKISVTHGTYSTLKWQQHFPYAYITLPQTLPMISTIVEAEIYERHTNTKWNFHNNNRKLHPE
jgi:hypothetical protein